VTLVPGVRLGPYEIVSPLGAGGMGQVYRARDTKLGRDVALKTLPDSFTHDPERLGRFRREAQVLAALNHPHIAQIHGLDEANGTQFLVLELVDGESLDKRIARGPILVDEALTIARQIAEALEAAHEKAIIHRDLKPANIAVTRDDQVKVLDFGLAKATDAASGTSGELANSPTITSPAMMTGVGVILGTAAYMAPEQARGRAADKRSDIWAFGCVVFEMLTGRRAFDGDDISTTLAAVLKTEPEWSAFPPTVPPSLCRLLGRCLHKDPKQRLRDIGDARIAIDDVLSGAEVPALTTFRRMPWWRRVVIPAAALVVGSLVTGLVVWIAMRSAVAQPRVSVLTITPPGTAPLSLNGATRDVAITPDGSRVIYVGANGTTLFVRRLDQLEATPLVRGDALREPFISPDGQWVGFFDGQVTLKRVAITGGPPARVAQFDTPGLGATWAADDRIIVATASSTTGLLQVSADGRAPTVLTRPDHARGEARHLSPELLPGGQAVLFTVTALTGGLDTASLALLDLRSKKSTILLRGGSHAQYVSSGHLVYAAGETLRAVGFDLTHLKIVGASTPVVPRVLTTSLGIVNAGVARDGTLIYVEGAGEIGVGRTLVWVDRQGHEAPVAAKSLAYLFPRLSPDGGRVAVTVSGQKLDIWLLGLDRPTSQRVTSDSAVHAIAVWTPDGHRLVFHSSGSLFSQAADGTGPVVRLTDGPNDQIPTDVAPDGTVVFMERSSTSAYDVKAVTLDGTHQVRPLVQTPFDERNGIVSPNGRWLAYEANDSGSFEIYVRPFPEVGRAPSQVSTSGGTQPLWAHDGRELFYFAPDGALMRVAVADGAAWSVGTPTKVLDGRYVTRPAGNVYRNYDIAADGQRFLMVKAAGSDATGAPQIVVIQHFDEELKRLVPTK
jgi:serine/threonine-protein kinase